jgi:hypothetical protein
MLNPIVREHVRHHNWHIPLRNVYCLPDSTVRLFIGHCNLIISHSCFVDENGRLHAGFDQILTRFSIPRITFSPETLSFGWIPERDSGYARQTPSVPVLQHNSKSFGTMNDLGGLHTFEVQCGTQSVNSVSTRRISKSSPNKKSLTGSGGFVDVIVDTQCPRK